MPRGRKLQCAFEKCKRVASGRETYCKVHNTYPEAPKKHRSKHGTKGEFEYWGCRCKRCVEAHRAMMREIAGATCLGCGGFRWRWGASGRETKLCLSCYRKELEEQRFGPIRASANGGKVVPFDKRGEGTPLVKVVEQLTERS